MGWCKEYQEELDELMKKWQQEIKDTLKKDAPAWNSVLGVGKSQTVIINDEWTVYRVAGDALDKLSK